MDMWTDTNSKMSYAGLNLTTVVEPSTETAAEPAQKQPLQLRVQSEVADLDVFPDSVHSGENIRDWLVALLKKLGINYSAIAGVTPDGAADGHKALNLIPELSNKVDTCLLHGLQRSVLYSVGKAGVNDPQKPKKSAELPFNEEAKQLCRFHGRITRASNQIRAVAYGIREWQVRAGVPSSRVLTTVDTMPTRWGNQFLQIRRNNTLRPVIDRVIEHYKTMHRNNKEAIVEDDPDDEGSKLGKSVPATGLGLTSDQWDESLELEAFLEHPYLIKEAIEHVGYMTGAQALCSIDNLRGCCANAGGPLRIKAHPPSAKLLDRTRKEIDRPAHDVSEMVKLGRQIMAQELKLRFFVEVPSPARLVQAYMSKQLPMPDWAPQNWLSLAKATYTNWLRAAATISGVELTRPSPTRTHKLQKHRSGIFRSQGPKLPLLTGDSEWATVAAELAQEASSSMPAAVPVHPSADGDWGGNDAMMDEMKRWASLDEKLVERVTDDNGLVNEMQLMWEMREKFPLHYTVFKQVRKYSNSIADSIADATM